MKNILYPFKTYMLLVFLFATTIIQSQIAVNTSPNTNTCNLNGDNVTVSVPTEALTGDNIPLNITLPGSYDAGCVKTVSITNSSNLIFQSSGAIPFTDMGGGTYQNAPSPTLNGNDGHNFNVFYKFPGYITCNGTVGTFDVTVTLDCAGVITTCTTSVNVIARAANYWSISKEFVTGDLTCGLSTWKIKLHHNNPNGSGLGTYKLSGTITESPSVPVVSGAVHTVNYSMASNSFYTKYITLQNCAPEGSIITNVANYNFTLGDGTCGTMSGSISANSDPLVSPNTDLSFVKYAYDNNGYPYTHPYFNIPPGCAGKYRIQAKNNGNVPWTNLVITDNFNIPGITITGISPPIGWSVTPSIPPYSNIFYTFTAPSGFILNPGEEINIWVDFEVNLTTSSGTTISNSANIDYQAVGTGSGNGSGGGSSPCPAINCPTIDTSLQNKTTSVDFDVATPEPRGSIKKCILNPPSTIVPPIYQIGDIIEFSVMIGNSGSGNLSTTLTDVFGMPGQNLEILPGTITYEYYADQNRGYRNSCSPPFGAPISPPFPVTANTTDLQNPFWNITNMPGICDYNRSNFLIIKFNAEVLAQLYGTKTNVASIPSTTGFGTHSSAVNYTIDQVGILGIFKKADTEIVENGQTFNYTITVSNNGSVPLDNIVITDILPDCVSVNGQLTIEDATATSIPFTTSGGLIININPTTQIFPGNDFTITIPVVKSGGGNCCNESVSVTAKMITSGVELNANYGSEEAPAACVTGTECCDVEDFEATIQENNETFNITINGGSVPLQEVEISMVDYHIEYLEEDCKPENLGIFGTLTTSTTNLGNLILNTGDNGTSSLTWQLGNPSIINGAVNLDILYPEVLNLDCCDVEFYFCLKVKVKDVNCNVCEKIICFSSDNQQTEPDPCEIDIKPFNQGQKYCAGDTINLNWSGSTPSSQVTISLFDNTNGTMYTVLATGIPNTGSFTYTIPTSLPCDPPRSWSFIVEDTEKLCFDKSDAFIIECCSQHGDCECGEWIENSVSIKGYHKKIPKNPKQKINFQSNFEKKIECGNEIELKPTMNYTFTAPNYVCNPENCDVEYKWTVVDPDGIILSDNGKTFNYTFTSYGTYKIIFTPICGGNECEPCVIYINIEKFISHEPSPIIGTSHELPTGIIQDVYNPKTGKIWMNKNLGATRVGTSPTDSAAFGYLYQWGRLTDGHEKRSSNTIGTLSNSDIPGHGKFITTSNSQSDWRSSKNNALWQGSNGTNNPCPSGYRLPTEAELNAERLTWVTNDAAGAFASPLKWVLAGARNKNGSLDTSNKGYYWSSSISGNDAKSLRIFNANANIYGGMVPNRGAGFSVRCIKN
ncbi:FISUMP domain-containing protein [uncultured Lutibacter sp.]|uniref:FISUMP domain-containing protein n=1 Tax=uncultured Lutibacter sp. TaxID=437739 RepID=UPI002608499D|nr:FISUMP domain-containing protein [uncultured Lutibacter sp.]